MAQYDLNLREYWWIFKKRKFVILGCAIALSLFSTSFAILKAPDPLYKSVCTIKFERETTVEGLYAKTISWSTTDDILTQTSIIKSFAVFKKVAEKLGLNPNGSTKENRNTKRKIIGIIENLQSKTEVKREEYTNILNIEVTDNSAEFAQKLADTIALTYQDFHTEQQMKRTTEAIKYIVDRLRDVRERLQGAEDEFNIFSQENELISIDLQSEKLIESAQVLKNKIGNLQEVKRELTRVLNRLILFTEDPSDSDYDFYTTKARNQYKATNDKLIEFRIKKVTLLEDYTSKHPDVVAINHRIFENARKMTSLLQLQIKDVEKEEKDFRVELEKVERTTSVLLDKKLEFNKLKRNLELYTEMTGLLEQKHEEALIRKAEKPEEVAIVKPALLPTAPINPPKTTATGLIGLVMGLVLGLVTAFILETFDTSLGAIEDVEETLGVQVLGVIPQADTKGIRDVLMEKFPDKVKEHAAKEAVNLVSHFVPKSMMAEGFRALRTNIQFKDVEKKIKTIAIVSTTLEEGKSLVSVNLALTMAQTGMKILLVGCDLRKPTVARTFGIELAPGMTDILLGNYPWRDTVKSVTDIIMGKMTMDEIMLTPGMDNLHIISSGAIPPNPAELVDSQRMMDFIEEVKQEFDFVIFDSTPILSTADAAILGTKVDGLLLVYRVGNVSRGLLRRSTAQLQQVNGHIMGVILNGMRPEISPDFQDLKYYSYYYSYGDNGERKNRGGRETGLTFPWKKRDSNQGAEKKKAIKKEKKHRKERVKKRTMLKFSLMLVGVAFLTVGILWQNGYVDPFTWIDFLRQVTQGQVKQPIRKEIPKQIIPKIAASSPFEPKPKAIKVTPVSKDTSSEGPVQTSAKETPPPVAAPSVMPKSMAANVMPVTKDKSSALPAQTNAKGTPVAVTTPDVEPQQKINQRATMPEGGVSGGPARPTFEVDTVFFDGSYGATNEWDLNGTSALTKDHFVEQMQIIPQKTTPSAIVRSVNPKKIIAKGTPLPVAEPKVAPQQKVSRKEVVQTPARPIKPKETSMKSTTVTKSETSTEPEQTNAVGAAMSPVAPSSVPKDRVVRGAAVLALSTALEPKRGTDQQTAHFESENSQTNPKSYPYSLYLGSFRTLERAKKAVSIYSKKGLSPHWVKVLLTSGVWYRVYGGHFESAEQAENFRHDNRLMRTKVKKTVYANFIGTYTSMDELEDVMRSLRELGFSPYVIEDDGKSRLFVGAFLPKQRAKRQYQELESSGIQNRIVKR